MIILKKQSRNTSLVPWESLSGVYDGTNYVFTTSKKYKPGSIIVLLNGQALFSDNDFLETGDNEITLIYVSPTNQKSLKATYILA